LAVEKLRRRFKPTERHRRADSTFDEIWNVQTDGDHDLSELQIVDRTNYLWGNRYQPTVPATFDAMVRSHPLPYEQCIFIDCGSGKGRVLLLASEFPFQRVIGVEFASDLNQVAQHNINTYNSPTQSCKQIETVCADATTFPFPPVPTVLFMANPFEGHVMEKFLKHVENSLRETPRPFFVLYRNPKYARLWYQSKCFLRVSATEGFVVYKAVM
jgi:hypothetical protein